MFRSTIQRCRRSVVVRFPEEAAQTAVVAQKVVAQFAAADTVVQPAHIEIPPSPAARRQTNRILQPTQRYVAHR